MRKVLGALCLFGAALTVSATNRNAREYKALCDLLSLGKGAPDLSITLDTSTAAAIVNDIFLLNLTTATESFKTNKDGELSPTKDDQKLEQIKQWKQNLEAIAAKTGDPPKAAYPMPQNPEAKAAANAFISKIHERAKSILENIQTGAASAKTETDNAKTLILDALYGDKNTKFEQAKLETNIDEHCKSDGANKDKIAISVSHDLMCICIAAKTSTDGNNICKHGISITTVGDGSGKTATATEYTKLENGCGLKKPPSGITGQIIRQRLNSFTTLIGAQAAAASTGPSMYVLGKPHTDGKCNGSSANGVCVDYTPHLADGNGQLPWEAKLLSAADKLDDAEAVMLQNAELTRELTNIQAAAWAELKAAASRTVETSKPAGSDGNPVEHGKKTCSKHETNTTCTENNCKWDGKTETGGTCKPKDGEGQTNQGAGDGASGAAAATSGCARHGSDKAACEKDKIGDKQNCAWRKGKEGETDEPEKKKCRSSSFLLKKQFALSVVSAAFVALLF
uniref:Variant surface glycoprotein 309 n=1 Tax=Trypanosoma brucei TaxID=5691 RepID=M4SXT8_9TRYP|nr:variant surface glycoprotein 309 [Trypanosoma brucei]